ncbi:MAG: hypothetical protein ACRYG2_25425 [Janthinobacterium lividum]
MLIIDAVISPGGTGLTYVGTTARTSYALGLPDALTKIPERGVSIWSIVVSIVLGMVFRVPAPSWQQLVAPTTEAPAIMDALAPGVARCPEEERPGSRAPPTASPSPGSCCLSASPLRT